MGQLLINLRITTSMNNDRQLVYSFIRYSFRVHETDNYNYKFELLVTKETELPHAFFMLPQQSVSSIQLNSTV